MKLHLPVRLFHTVIALMAATVPFPAFAAPKYTVADGSQLTLSELTKLSISGYSASAYGAYENINHNGYLGGAIYARGTASVYIINNSVVLLSDNYAKNSDSKSSRGGAIYAYSGDVVLNKNNSITFSNNYATYYTSGSYGGAIYCYQGAISLIENDTVSFSSNYASARTGASYGGAIYSNEGSITLSKNKSLYFSENYTEDYVYSSSYGGAIYSEIGAITLSENEKVVFSKNHAEASSASESDGPYSSYGGAICSNRAAVTLIENTNLIFSENYVLSSAYQAAYGGAIYSNSGAISLRRNENITFSKNYASASETASSSYTNIYSYGGALYNNSGNTILNENESITFSSNSSSASISATSSIATTSAYSYGGALYSSSGLISLSTNENTSFIGNHTSTTATSSSSSSSYNPANVNSYSYGGVIYSNSGAISLSQNDNIIFSSNYVSSISTTDKSSAYSYSRGGAIYDNSNVITLSENTTITFSGNYATATSTATTTANAFSYGGAIYGKTSIVNNGSVIFRDNSVRSQSIGAKTALGGAIYGSSINIRNNKTVVFEGNYEKSGSSSYTYCLRCLYATGSVNLSANADNSVKFRDSLYTGADLILNEQYGDIAQTGDIIFSGEYTKKHLSELKSNYSATELQNSLTSIVKGKTTLYDGRLIIREGAILQGTGIDINTSVSGKYVTTVLLQNGYLNQGDYDISFATGTVLEAGGINEMTGNRWTMANGSSITLHAAAENANTAVLSYNGHFFMGESLTLNISFNPEEAKNGTYKLLNVTSFVDESNWTAENVTITGLNGLEISFEDLYWDDEILYFNYLSDNSAGPGTGGNGGSGTEPGGSDVTPYFFVGTWTNESGNGLWDNSSLNWEQNELDYAYSDGADVLFGDAGAGTVTLVVDLAPSSVLVNSTKDYTWVADEDFGGSLTGVMVLTKQGEGTLTICTDNSYMGGTNIEGGKLSVQHVNALGKGDIALSAGTLEMNGYAVQNNITASGGTLSGATNYGGSLQIAGDVALNGQVKATNGIQLLSGSVSGGSIADTKVVATGDSSVEIATSLSGTTSLSATGTVTLSGANSHTGGTMFNGATLTLSHSDALGQGDVVTNGANAMTATTTVNLNSVILNSGELTLTGTYNASALSLQTHDSSYIDANGNTASSGFLKAEGCSVQVVSGGTVSGGATIKYDSLTLTLGSDGYATGGGGITYGTYYLNDGDSVSVSAAEQASANALESVSMTGGTLYADASTSVKATGGNILLSAGTLSGTAKDADVTATGGILSASLSGTGYISAKGSVTISGSNSHTGGTMFNGGSFNLTHAEALGNGTVMTTGTNTLLGSTAQAMKSTILNSGVLTLSGSWNLSALDLSTQVATHVDVNGRTGESGFRKSTLYEVRMVQGGTTAATDLILEHNKLADGLQLVLGSNGVAAAGGVVDYTTYYLNGRDSVSVSEAKAVAGSSLNQIEMNGGNLTVDDSTHVTATGGSITVTDDTILSGSITDTDMTFAPGDYSADIRADIKGNSSLTINGGNVTLSGDNSYTGGTIINGGSLIAKDADALGTGTVTVNGGTLNLNNQQVGNDITLNNGTLVGNDQYNGNLSIGGDNVAVEGGYTLGSGKVLEIAVGGTEFNSDLTLGGGTLLFKGAPLTVNGEVNFAEGTTTLVDLRSWEGQLTDGLTLAVLGTDVTGWTDGCLELIGMSDMSLAFDNSTGSLTLQIEGEAPVVETITWLGTKGMVWQNGKAGWMNATTGYDAVFESGAEVIFTQPGTVTIAGAVEPGSMIVAGDKSITFKADKLNPGRIVGGGSLTKRGNGKLTLNDGNTYSGGTFIEAGTLTAGGANSFGRGDIFISGGTLDLKSKAVLNDITLSDAASIKGGKKYLGSYTQTGGELMKGSVLNISESATLSGGVVNGSLSGVGTVAVDGEVELGLTGKITTDKLLVNGALSASTKGLVMNSKTSAIEINGGMLSSKGKVSAAALKLNGGSLCLNGALSVKDLTLGSGTLTLDSAKLTTVKVGNSLTLEGGTTLNLGFTVTEKDVAKGKSYKVFTFKMIDDSITDAALNELLGLGTDAATLAFDTKRKSITLTVTDAAAWNEYAESVRNGTWVAPTSEDDVLVKVGEAAAFVLARPTADVDPLLGKVADTLVQSTWGTASAARAFGDTIAARGTHATALADGKGAAWISTMGGSSRISSDGGHAGADSTLTGAAFGMEARLSESSTVGLAIGNSWGKVSTFSAFPVDQDSTHQGIYGKHNLGSSTTLSWMAAHTRTESDANLAGMACDWTQDALQLDARVDKLFALSDRTTVSAFVGMQYLATDKGECDGLSTGSLQNLRGEIGVSAGHKATDRTYIYGELSFIGDMVRHNPTATVGDYRSRGANPGRAGLNLSVGASYQLNDSWSLNGSYSLELMQNRTSHSANVGATYSF